MVKVPCPTTSSTISPVPLAKWSCAQEPSWADRVHRLRTSKVKEVEKVQAKAQAKARATAREKARAEEKAMARAKDAKLPQTASADINNKIDEIHAFINESKKGNEILMTVKSQKPPHRRPTVRSRHSCRSCRESAQVNTGVKSMTPTQLSKLEAIITRKDARSRVEDQQRLARSGNGRGRGGGRGGGKNGGSGKGGGRHWIVRIDGDRRLERPVRRIVPHTCSRQLVGA